MKNKIWLSLATFGITFGVVCLSLLGAKFTNYKDFSTNPITGNYSSSSSVNSNGEVAHYGATNSGLDVGSVSTTPNVSFDFNDFKYIRNEFNCFSVLGVNFTTAFDQDSNPDGYYVQMLISLDGDLKNPFSAIYMTNDGTTPADAPLTGSDAYDVTINSPASDHDYYIAEGPFYYLDGNTKYEIAITYGNSQTNREPVATPTFATPKLLSNDFDSNTITYTKNADNYSTISSIDFNFGIDLQNVSKNNFYVLITIINLQGEKLAGLYLTASGNNPINTDSSIVDLLPTQAISSTATSYSATNLTTKFSFDTTYTVNYGIGSGNKSPDFITEIDNGVNFKTPKYTNPNNQNTNTSKIVGGVVGGVGGVSILGGSALIAYFFLRRKRKRA